MKPETAIQIATLDRRGEAEGLFPPATIAKAREMTGTEMPEHHSNEQAA